MNIRENELNNNNNRRRQIGKRSSSVYVVQKKRNGSNNSNKNFKQIFVLSFDALRERKARSGLTILMVLVGSALMVAFNGMSAGQTAVVNKQLIT